MQRFGRVGELRIAHRPECGFNGRARRTGHDQRGAPVLGASVVVQNLQTGVKQSTETNHAGLYRFPVLRPGSYSIAASLKGFRDVQALVRVLVGNSTSLDMNLQWEPAQTRLR
jgi:hypothetical protein